MDISHMAQFAGREKELEALERLYSADGLRTCSVYGRSRTGTSGLVREFCKGKPAIIVRFPEGTLREMLESICDSVTRYTSEDIPLPVDYDEAFSAIGAACGGDGTVVVLDDAANADSLEFRKALGRFIDGHIRDSDNMLILCGSPENAMVSMTERSPLKDRIKDAVVLRPLSFAESRELHGKMKDLDAYKCHLTVGGIPLYHLLMNKSDYETCVEKCFLGTYPRLCAEAENIVRKSSVPYRYCSAILSEMAKGCGRPIDLANDQGISRQLCEVYLKKMESEGMIARVNPIANAPKKPVFTVKNPLLGFYHTVIRNNSDIVLADRTDFSDIAPEAGMFLELRFRSICYGYLKENFDCKAVGGWWIAGESTNSINLAAVIEKDGSEYTLVCDCKFRKGKIDTGALKNLKKRAEAVEADDKRLAMFSASGFDGDLVKTAEKEGILLIGPKELLN